MLYTLTIQLPKKINPDIFIEANKKTYPRSKTDIKEKKIKIQAKDKTALRAATLPLLRLINLHYSLKH